LDQKHGAFLREVAEISGKGTWDGKRNAIKGNVWTGKQGTDII
jgi:hypothetical protein